MWFHVSYLVSLDWPVNQLTPKCITLKRKCTPRRIHCSRRDHDLSPWRCIFAANDLLVYSSMAAKGCWMKGEDVVFRVTGCWEWIQDVGIRETFCLLSLWGQDVDSLATDRVLNIRTKCWHSCSKGRSVENQDKMLTFGPATSKVLNTRTTCWH